jgi:CBS domain-containing protein
MPSIQHVLAHKGTHVWSISPDATVFEGLRLMSEKNIGALLIVDNGAPVGIMSERDYARKIILDGRSSRETRIKTIMTTRLVGTRVTDTVEEAMAVMTRERIRHLPALDGTRVVGLVSLGDLVKAMIDQQQFTIDQLERYIAS